jgi:hypothetical protein
MTEGFSLQIARSDDDYRALRRQTLREMSSRPFYRGFSWICGAIGFLAALALTNAATQFRHPSLGAPGFFLMVFAFFGMWWLLSWIIGPFLESRLYPPLRIFRSPLELALNSGGIQITGEFNSQFLAWPAISDVVETPAHLFLRIDGASAVVIPKRAFMPVSQVSEFVNAVRDRLAAAQVGMS